MKGESKLSASMYACIHPLFSGLDCDLSCIKFLLPRLPFSNGLLAVLVNQIVRSLRMSKYPEINKNWTIGGFLDKSQHSSGIIETGPHLPEGVISLTAVRRVL